MLLALAKDDDGWDCSCCACVGGGDGDGDGGDGAPADCSTGRSDVLPLLAISASTIWTILSLLDGESNGGDPILAADGEGVLVADAALGDGDGDDDTGLDGASDGSV